MSEGAGGVLTRSRVSTDQLDLLLSFMEEHPDFAAGKQSIYSRFSSSKLWRLLAERLNAAAADSGGARKSPDKWCRYWADIKYKARKKCAAGGALGDLSSSEERLRAILGGGGGGGHCGYVGGGAGAGAGVGSHSDSEERKPALEEDMCSEASGGGGGGGGAGSEGARLTTEELLAEAAMRSALAAEKQAEAVTQGVELLRELVSLVRERALSPGGVHAPQHAHAQHAHAPQHAEHALPALHHHHRL